MAGKKGKFKASSNEATTVCPTCGDTITYDMSTQSEQDAIESHDFYVHEIEPIILANTPAYKDSDITAPATYTTPKPTKAQQRKAAEKQAVEEGEMVVPEKKATPTKTEKSKGQVKEPCQYCGKSYTRGGALTSHERACVKKLPENPTLDDIDNRAALLIAHIYEIAETAQAEAKANVEFYKRVEVTRKNVEGYQKALTVLRAAPQTPTVVAEIEGLEKLVADSSVVLAKNIAEPAYQNGKEAEDDLVRMQMVKDAQKDASEHNNDLRNHVTKELQAWLDDERDRFTLMYNGELWVPTNHPKFRVHNAGCAAEFDKDKECDCKSKIGKISFMHDTIWRMKSAIKAKGYDLKAGITPEEIREVWPVVFAKQMERYGFTESREFSHSGREAHVDEKTGTMKLGELEAFSEVGHLPFDQWSDKILNDALLVINKYDKGYNTMKLLAQFGFQGKADVDPPVLGREYLSFVSEREFVPQTQMHAVLHEAGLA